VIAVMVMTVMMMAMVGMRRLRHRAAKGACRNKYN